MVDQQTFRSIYQSLPREDDFYTPLDTNQSNNSSIDDDSEEDDHHLLDPCEIVELGLAKEVISDELYFPAHPTRNWIRCHLTVTETGGYRFYLEGKRKNRFLLSAKQFPGVFYLSTHEAFPELDVIPTSGYLGRLQGQKDRSYLLYLNFCHLCDQKFGYFRCGIERGYDCCSGNNGNNGNTGNTGNSSGGDVNGSGGEYVNSSCCKMEREAVVKVSHRMCRCASPSTSALASASASTSALPSPLPSPRHQSSDLTTTEKKTLIRKKSGIETNVMEYRSVEVAIPAISKSGKRKIWCERSFRSSNPSSSYYPTSRDVDMFKAIQLDRKMSQRFVSKSPEWNQDIQTLVVKFQGNRILLPSTKNFLLCEVDNNNNNNSPSMTSRSESNLSQYFMSQPSPVLPPPPPPPLPSTTTSPACHPPPLASSWPLPLPQPPYPPSVSSSASASPSSRQWSPNLQNNSNTNISSSNQYYRKALVESSKSLSTDDFATNTALRAITVTGSSHNNNINNINNNIKVGLSRSYDPSYAILRDVNLSKDSPSLLTKVSSLDESVSLISPNKKRSTRAASMDIQTYKMGDDAECDSQQPRAILQFGRCSASKYVLDFRYPLSPLQAFGIALASFTFERHGSATSVISDGSDL